MRKWLKGTLHFIAVIPVFVTAFLLFGVLGVAEYIYKTRKGYKFNKTWGRWEKKDE
jgi:hypothetical protein